MREQLTEALPHLRYEAWSRGELRWKLHAGQKRIDDAFNASKHETFFFGECARQFAKTTWSVAKVCETALRYPGCSMRIATAYYADIKTLIRPAFRFVQSDCPEEFLAKHVPSEGLYRWPNGSEAILVGLDTNPDKLRGNRLRLVVIDEAGFVNSDTLQYVVDSVIEPAFTHEPDARCIFISTPPQEGQDHSFCEMADVAALNGAYIKLTIHDNPLLSPERRKAIEAKYRRRNSMVAFRREYLCERIIDSTRAVVPEFSEALHVKKAPRPAYWPFLHRYAALDSGVRDKTVGLSAYYDFPRAKLVVERELALQNEEVTTRNIVSRFRSIESELGYDSVYRRVADNDNLILVQDLTSEGLTFFPTSKDSLEAMINVVRLWFKDDRIEIDPSCKTLIGTCRSQLWNKNRTDLERSKAYGHGDAFMALVYLIRNINTHTDPIPKTWGVNLADTVFPNRLIGDASLSPDASAVKRAFQGTKRK